MIKTRLAKYLSRAGIASRRQAEEMIRQGRVTVNGELANLPQIKVTAEDAVKVDGKLVRGEEKKEYYLLHKPTGVISTVKDTHGRPKVLDLIKGSKAKLYPVGRLDADTSGVLLLTNDGLLTHRLTHPSFMVRKVYHAKVRGKVRKEALEALKEGPLVEGKKTSPLAVKMFKTKPSDDYTLLEIVLSEGRKRQVRKMCQAVGHPVVNLERFSFAGLTTQDLAPGRFRKLNAEEVERLYRLTGIKKS